jgi:hypothetical protein
LDEKTGPSEVSFIIKPTIGVNHDKINTITNKEKMISNTLLINLLNSSCNGSSRSVITGMAPYKSILILRCLKLEKSGVILKPYHIIITKFNDIH